MAKRLNATPTIQELHYHRSLKRKQENKYLTQLANGVKTSISNPNEEILERYISLNSEEVTNS